MPAKPGPRRAHKLTEEIVAFARAAREVDPSMGSAGLAAATTARFGVVVHPRSVERALARTRAPNVEARREDQHGNDKEDSDVEGYEQLRARALCGDAAGWRLGLAVLQHRGLAAWLRRPVEFGLCSAV